MKADLFISVTKKIKEEYNNKINIFTNLIFHIGLVSTPIIILDLLVKLRHIIAGNDFLENSMFILCILLAIVSSSLIAVLFISLCSGLILSQNLFLENLIHKIRLRKKMTKEEKLINIENICFKEENFKDGLMDYYISFLDQELSQEDFKKAIELIFEEKLSTNNKLKIINYLIFKKYKNQDFIELIYNKNKNEVLYQLTQEIPKFKNTLEDLIKVKIDKDDLMESKGLEEDFILDNVTIEHIINYKDFEKILKSVHIVDKMITKYDIKNLIKIIFEKNINNIKNDELELYKFINNLDLERKIEIQKIIINKVLNLKDEKNILDYKEDFLNVASALNVDKDLLYLMNQKITQKEKVEQKNLRIINI